MKQNLTEEQILKNYIKKIVRESLNSMEENMFMEKKSKDKKKYEDKDSKDKNDKQNKGHKKADKSQKESNRQRRRRIQVEKFLKQDGVNPAQYFYKLFGTDGDTVGDNNDKKNYRSLGYKKRDHELNSDGYPYEFSPEEVNRLISLISGHEIA